MLTEESRLQDFPALADMAYLNTAAESIPPVCVHEALAQYARDKGMGMRGRVPHNETMEACRKSAARIMAQPPGDYLSYNPPFTESPP